MYTFSICILYTHIIETKTNTEAKAHFESKHPTSTFTICFPTATFDPFAVPIASATPTTTSTGTTAGDAVAAVPKKAVKKDDLSFLDSSLAPVNIQKKVGKK